MIGHGQKRAWILGRGLGLFALCACLVAVDAHATPIIQNGNFEQGTGQTAWTFSGHAGVVGQNSGGVAGSSWWGGGSPAQDGSYVVEFNDGNATPNGTVSQSFTTVAGMKYLVEFFYGVTNVVGGSQSILAQIIGSDASTVLGSTNASGTASGNHVALPLNAFSFTFTGDGGTDTIWFKDFASNPTISLDGILDNVSVTAVPVPGPGQIGWTTMVLGLLFLGWSVRRRRQDDDEAGGLRQLRA